MDFTISPNHRLNIKEREKINVYRDLDKNLKNLKNMKTTVVPVIVGTLEIVLKITRIITIVLEY